jgi:hypothetical protein
VGRYLPSVTQKYEKYEDSSGLFKDDSDSVICSSDYLCSSELAYSLQGDPPSEEVYLFYYLILIHPSNPLINLSNQSIP